MYPKTTTRVLLVRWAFLLAACTICIGCSEGGPELAPVTGVVTMDGQPLPGVAVTFKPQVEATDGGANSFGVTDETGKYKLGYPGEKTGAVVGTHKVTVANMEGAATKIKIPRKYSGEGTELTREVQPGANEINLELTSK